MDYQGNIKGMARGMSPVICQGWKENEKKYNCLSDRLAKLQGRLNCSEEEKAFKVVHSLERVRNSVTVFIVDVYTYY